MSISDIVSMLSNTVEPHYLSDPLLLAALIPIKIYSNVSSEQDTILKENQNKSGIYMWENKINGKRYIGSAVNLSNRLSNYYSTGYMENKLKNSKSSIYNAILKHGHSNFSLTILEYCDKEKCIQREDFYLSCLPHEYNILEKAGSSLGHKYSDESKIIMSDAKKGEKNPMFGKTGENHPMYNKPRAEGAGKPSQAIEVTDNKNNQTTTYESICEAARALNIPSHKSISKYFSNNQQKPYKGQYIFKKI